MGFFFKKGHEVLTNIYPLPNMEDDEEWRPESANDVDESPNITDTELKKLASQIGINYVKPRPQTVFTNRSVRQRKKPVQFVPRENIRDFRGVKERRQELKCRKKNRTTACAGTMRQKRKHTNVFGGINSKKQRSIFQNKFAKSVHRPLDVYNGKYLHTF